jgi:hypothetical protein
MTPGVVGAFHQRWGRTTPALPAEFYIVGDQQPLPSMVVLLNAFTGFSVWALIHRRVDSSGRYPGGYYCPRAMSNLCKPERRDGRTVLVLILDNSAEIRSYVMS